MNNLEMQINKNQANSEVERVIGEIIEAPIDEKELNVCYEELKLDSQTIYLRRKKVKRRKAGGIF